VEPLDQRGGLSAICRGLTGAGRRAGQLIAGMSGRIRLMLFGTAGLSAICFLLWLIFAESPANKPDGTGPLAHVLIGASILAALGCLIMLHGYGTSCPSCCKWWARRDTGNELAESDVHYLDGAGERDPSQEKGRAAIRVVTYHYKHQCVHCNYRWITVFTESYRSVIRRRRRQTYDLDPLSEKRRRISDQPL
jgi:hypothetical protein